MIRHRVPVVLALVALVLTTSSMVGKEPHTRALFNLDTPAGGPFPSDWFTVPDDAQNTGRHVSLPLPDCERHASRCEDLAVINELDGFNLQPRLSIPFDGPIDADSVTSETVFLISLGSTLPSEDAMPRGTVVGVDQVVWETSTNTLHVESDAPLAQHTRFALFVTNGIRDANGARVKAGDAFERFRATVRDDYKQALLDAMQAARDHGIEEDDLVVASVFTTQSATAVLEKIRDLIHGAPAEPADFTLGSRGERTVFRFDDVTSVVWTQQTKVAPPYFSPAPALLDLAAVGRAGAVATIAFGKFRAPDYRVHPGEYIPAVPTRNGTPLVRGTNELLFDLFLPSGVPPAGGWPVAIVGHGVNQSKDGNPLNVVSSLAEQGIAAITINASGHGFGPRSTLTVNRFAGDPVTLEAGGRGIDQNGDGAIGNAEGAATPAPRGIVFFADTFRQTAVELMQLVRVIQAGLDADDDGQPDIDPSRIYFLGNSLSGGSGTAFMAVEPHVQVGVLNVPGNPASIGHLSPVRRNIMGSLLAARRPASLINFPGIRIFDGVVLPAPPYFDENLPLRERRPLTVQLEDLTVRVVQSPVINSISGANAIQEGIDEIEWVNQQGSPVAYAVHLRRFPLPGVPAKMILLGVAKGDQGAPNPHTSAILRAGGLADRTLYYRHDLAWKVRGEFPNLPKNPHSFTIDVANFGTIALDAQARIALFLASHGTRDPVPARFFEFPPVGPLPEDLNFIR